MKTISFGGIANKALARKDLAKLAGKGGAAMKNMGLLGGITPKKALTKDTLSLNKMSQKITKPQVGKPGVKPSGIKAR